MIRSTMTAHCLVLAWFISGFAVAGFAAPTSNPIQSKNGTLYTVPHGKPAFDQTGAQVGEQIPDLPVYSNEGDVRELHGLLDHSRATLFLTSSFTCPKSRAQYPEANEIAKQFKSKINIVIVYVLEAHPERDPCPYTGAEDITAENLRDRILRRQPTRIEQRTKLASEFTSWLDVKLDVYLDSMDNLVWRAFGGGPNMAVLVNPNGIVVARQGWFDPPQMSKQIESYLLTSQPPIQSNSQDDPFLKETHLSEWDIISPFKRGELKQAADLLDQFPKLVSWTEPYQPRGSSGDCSLLQIATQAGQLEIAKLLLDRHADVNFQSIHLATPLHLAAQNGNLAMVDLLLARHADVNCGANVGSGTAGELFTGPTPLQTAVVFGKLDVAKRLIEFGAKKNFFTDAGLGDVVSLKRAIQADASATLRPDGFGRSPLFYAVGAGSVEAIRLLLAQGAIVDRPAHSVRETPLHWAIQRKQLESVMLLLDAGADVNGASGWGETPVDFASRLENADILKLLLARHADPNRMDVRGRTPLHWAAGYGSFEIVEALIDGGANVNLPTGADGGPCAAPFNDEFTPLHYAVRAGRLDTARKLIAAGAQVNAETYEGHTALKLARELTKADQSAAMIALLKEHGGREGSGARHDGSSTTLPKSTPMIKLYR